MKFLPFVLKHLRRNWIRTLSTVLAMAVCIFLFCTLQTILASINGMLESSSATRLISRNAVSLVSDGSLRELAAQLGVDEAVEQVRLPPVVPGPGQVLQPARGPEDRGDVGPGEEEEPLPEEPGH